MRSEDRQHKVVYKVAHAHFNRPLPVRIPRAVRVPKREAAVHHLLNRPVRQHERMNEAGRARRPIRLLIDLLRRAKEEEAEIACAPYHGPNSDPRERIGVGVSRDQRRDHLIGVRALNDTRKVSDAHDNAPCGLCFVRNATAVHPNPTLLIDLITYPSPSSPRRRPPRRRPRRWPPSAARRRARWRHSAARSRRCRRRR